MIYGVKGSREIKQTEAGDLLTTNQIRIQNSDNYLHIRANLLQK